VKTIIRITKTIITIDDYYYYSDDENQYEEIGKQNLQNKRRDSRAVIASMNRLSKNEQDAKFKLTNK
jgi:hypothetical protein